MRPCNSHHRAAHDSGPRRSSAIRQVVIHSTEGGTARSVAVFFATTAQASTHLVIDDEECYRCLPDLVIPWGAPGVNTSGLHTEHCGYAKWTRAEWRVHMPMLRESAKHTAYWCWKYDIPRRWVGWVGLRLKRKGITTHADASRAFNTPGGHTDPGPGFPKDIYLGLVRDEYARLKSSHH